MSVLCKTGLHRWKEVGVSGPFLFPLSECRRCGTGRVSDYMGGSSIISPVAMERSAMAGLLREVRKHHEREINKVESIAVKAAHLTILEAVDRMSTEYETGDRA